MGDLISGDSKMVSPLVVCERVNFEKSASPTKWLKLLFVETGAVLQPDKIAAHSRTTMFDL